MGSHKKGGLIKNSFDCGLSTTSSAERLLMDGYSTHYCPETMVLAAKERVVDLPILPMCRNPSTRVP